MLRSWYFLHKYLWLLLNLNSRTWTRLNLNLTQVHGPSHLVRINICLRISEFKWKLERKKTFWQKYLYNYTFMLLVSVKTRRNNVGDITICLYNCLFNFFKFMYCFLIPNQYNFYHLFCLRVACIIAFGNIWSVIL